MNPQTIRKLNTPGEDREHENETTEVLHLPDPDTFRKLSSSGTTCNLDTPTIQENSQEKDGEARSKVLERMTSRRRVKHNISLENWRSALSKIAKVSEMS